MGSVLCVTRSGEGGNRDQKEAIRIAKKRGDPLVFLYVADSSFLNKLAQEPRRTLSSPTPCATGMIKIIPSRQILWYHGLVSRSYAAEVQMSKTTVRFIKMSLIYLALGATLAGLFLVFPRLLGLKFTHVHFNLLGFMSMIVFGVAYHILPRFQGKPLYSERMADVHFWLANIGLIGLVAFSAARAYGSALPLTIPLALSGITAAVSVYLFVANMWLTFSKPIPMR